MHVPMHSLWLQLLDKHAWFRFTPQLIQIREKGSLIKPRLKNPFWFVKKNRASNYDQVTSENKTFLQEILNEKYGTQTVNKEILTSKNSTNTAKLDETKKEWSTNIKRTGVLARKIGQYPMWLKTGERIRTTLLQVVDNHVIKYIPPEQYDCPRITLKYSQKTIEKPKKYGCLLVGAESADPSVLTKEYCGLFKDSGVMPKKHLGRFIISTSAALCPGTPLTATHFRVGDFVDVRGKTIDRGFQGVVKRWGFKGMPASHGVTKTHRRPGNIGGGGEKGRVWPGTKMPGHMGNRWRVLKGLKIWRINTKYNVIWVQGSSIPGDTNSMVYIYDTILPLRRVKIAPPFPTSYDDKNMSIQEEIFSEDVHNFRDPSIEFKEIKEQRSK